LPGRLPGVGLGLDLAGRARHEAENVRILAGSGMVAPLRPDKAARLAVAAARWGASPATGVIAGAIRHPGRTMLLDERGALTYAEVDERTNRVTRVLRGAGVQDGDRVGVMCRDHRGFVDAVIGAAKAGADVVLLNTAFAGPQLAEVARREDAAALVYDEEFGGLMAEASEGRARFVAWHEDAPDAPALEHVMGGHDGAAVTPPGHTSHVTILTSGTTGTPKGATRENVPRSLDAPAAILERIPLHEGERTFLAAPMFHAWGFSNFALGMALGATFVLRRRFDPEATLEGIAEHRCEALVVVPVMLQRILELGPEARERHDTSSLRVVAASGSALPADLAQRWMDAFGDNLFNLYGSTEVSQATIATPKDLREAPGTAGRPTRGTVVRLYGEDGQPVGQGETGRIFVGNSMLFEGYTGGGGKDRIDGLMATGDVGRFDEDGRLFVQGRDDEMIVSGGENVFPKEVEDALMRHTAVAEAAAVGVADDTFGQRLRAFVVLAPGQRATAKQLQDHVKAQLARYKVPRDVVFLDELPRNPTGKVLKRELAEREG
jgi:acyl-CoA synthetase (AMP-forming)/AMP-acid ligase II